MRLSQLATRTSKDTAAEDVSRNAQLLTRAGYVHKLIAGVYSYLPLGLRTLAKIEQIIREEMDALGAQEVLLPALQPKENWEATGRWDHLDVLFKLKGAGDRDLALGATHEEVVTPAIGSYIQSYRDLPRETDGGAKAVYQIQTKFRNEPRAKSGLMRGREFRMKDLYSFHQDQADLDAYYDRAAKAYARVYDRVGLGDRTLFTFASGGTFAKYSHEYQTITEYGEDVVYRVPGTMVAINKEIIDDKDAVAAVLKECNVAPNIQLEELKAIEVGNIFKLGTKYSRPFGLRYSDESGAAQEVIMGCYGLGCSRLMGAIAETLSDERGLVWPAAIAPYQVQLVSLGRDEAELQAANDLYRQLQQAGVEVLFDDRAGVQAGEKFADADLIGLPWRAVVSKKTLAQNAVELKARSGEAEAELVPLDQLIARLKTAA